MTFELLGISPSIIISNIQNVSSFLKFKALLIIKFVINVIGSSILRLVQVIDELLLFI